MGENLVRQDLRDALGREIDEGEVLRWVGAPDAEFAERRARKTSIVVSVGLLGMMVFAGYGAYRFYLEATGQIPPDGPKGQSFVPVWICGFASCFAGLGSWFMWNFPRYEAETARRTVYAVTSTRVMSLIMNPNGTVATESVEPGHPMSVARNEMTAELGHVHLYPRVGQQGLSRGISLMNVASPREVERLIRQTFDPVGGKGL